MSTRGFISFAVNGETKTAYNHSDSYPDGLGLTVLEWLREVTADRSIVNARAAAAELRVAAPDSKPTAEDVERLRKFADTRVSSKSLDEWYVLLRETQGNPALMLAAGVIEDASNFPADSLFAEWGYVVDFDGDGMFEVYEGFQKAPHDKGRFAGMPKTEEGVAGDYYPVALMASWPLAELPSNAAFMAAFESSEDEEESA